MMWLGFLGATEITFAKSNPSVSGGQVSIEIQRAFTFGDALSGAFGKDLDHAKEAVRQGVVWRVGNHFGQRRFGRLEACGSVAAQHRCPLHGVDECRANDCFNVVGVEAEGLFEKACALATCLRDPSRGAPRHALEIQVHRVRMGRPRRAPSLRRDQLRSQLIGKAAPISSCMSNRSVIGLSKRSAHRWLLVSALMS